MSTEHTLLKVKTSGLRDLELSVIESSSKLTLYADDSAQGIVIDTELTEEQVTQLVVRLAHAGSYCSADPHLFLQTLADRVREYNHSLNKV